MGRCLLRKNEFDLSMATNIGAKVLDDFKGSGLDWIRWISLWVMLGTWM